MGSDTLVARLRHQADWIASIRKPIDSALEDTDMRLHREAADTIESLRASLTRVEEETLAACDKYEQEWRDAAKAAQDPDNQALFERFGNIVRNTRHLVAQCLSRAIATETEAPGE